MKRRLIGLVLLVSIATGSSCTRARTRGRTPNMNATSGDALHLDSVRPDSVTMTSGAVVEVVLHGHGFAPGAPGRNTIVFGTLVLNDVPANADGTEIRLVIPESLPSGGGAAPMPIMPGPYAVRVRAPSGDATAESNSATVRIFR